MKRGPGWLPLIGVNALIGSGVTLALPTVLGRSVDSIVAGAERNQWLIAVLGLITLGIAASLIDVFKGASANIGADYAGLAAVTTIAAVTPPAGSLVLLAAIDPALAAAFFGSALAALAVRWTDARRTADISLAAPEPNSAVTWRILARPDAQAATVCPMVAVLAVGGFQLAAAQISAGEIFAAVQYAVLGSGLRNLGEIAQTQAGAHRAAESSTVKSIAHRGNPPAVVQRAATGRHRFVA